MNSYLINHLGKGHTIALYFILILLMLVSASKIDIVKRINYAFDYELGIAHQCNGTDYAYETLGCKYDYSEYFSDNRTKD